MALLHDAPEYVIGDLISPFKAAVGIDYKALELRLQAAIHLRFGLPAARPGLLQTLFKKADRLSAYSRGHPAGRLRGDGGPPPFRRPAQGMKTPRLTPLPTAEAQGSSWTDFTGSSASEC